MDYPGLVARDHRFSIVKIHGDAAKPETVVLGSADYRAVMYANDPFEPFFTTLLYWKTVLFVGCSLEDPHTSGSGSAS